MCLFLQQSRLFYLCPIFHLENESEKAKCSQTLDGFACKFSPIDFSNAAAYYNYPGGFKKANAQGSLPEILS